MIPFQRTMTLNKEAKAIVVNPENINKRIQDLIETVCDIGQFYLARSERLPKYHPYLNIQYHLIYRGIEYKT